MTGCKKIESRPKPPNCDESNFPLAVALIDLSNMAGKKPRKVLTLSDRLKIIKAVEDNPSKTRTLIANEFDIPLPTLSNILREKSKYLKQAASGDIASTSKRARGSHLAVDKSLLDWFTSSRWAFLIFL